MVNASYYILLSSKDVKFLHNIKDVKVGVIHTSKRIKDLVVLLISTSYINKISSNNSASIWYKRFGHINMDKLKAIVIKNLIYELPSSITFNGGNVCEGYQY